MEQKGSQQNDDANRRAVKKIDAQEESLTSCLLSQYRLCAAGIGLGTAYSLRYKKGLVPMIAAGAIGTTADMVYGYLVECSQFVGGSVDPKNVGTSSKGDD